MDTYKKPQGINTESEYKSNFDAGAGFNEQLTELAIKERGDFEEAQAVINGLKLNNAKGGNFGQLGNLNKAPETNTQMPKFLAGELKTRMFDAVSENDTLKIKKLNSDVDKLVGVLSIFQNNNKKLNEAINKPLGGPGSPNIGLMADNVNILKYAADWNVNGDKNFNLGIDDNDELTIQIPGQEALYVTQLTNMATNPNMNSEMFIPTIGDPQTLIYDKMDTSGTMPVVEQLATDLEIQLNEGNKEFSIKDDAKMQENIIKYNHENILNLRNVSQSLWPIATQMAVSVLNGAGENPSPLESEILDIVGKYQDYIGEDYNLISNYEQNGQKSWGNYIGADVNYSQENSTLVDFQRDILSWSFNKGYHDKNISPYVKQEQAVKQGETSEGVIEAKEDAKNTKDSQSDSMLDIQIDKV